MARLLHIPSMRRHALRAAALAAAMALSWIPVGCDGDDETLPAYCQDLAELETDADGFAGRLVTDAGESLPVTNRKGGLTGDSVYRATVLYTREADGAVLHSATSVLSPFPKGYSEEAVKTDPVELDAIWRGGRYLNLRVTLQSGGLSHRLGFIDRGVTEGEDGTRVLHVELLHDQNGDPLYYPRETILSCPLYPYADRLRTGTDSVSFTLRTFEGTLRRVFPY